MSRLFQYFSRTSLSFRNLAGARKVGFKSASKAEKRSVEMLDEPKKNRNSMVEAAFEALKNGQISGKEIKTSDAVDPKVINAVNSLLTITESNVPLARKIISMLSEWNSKNSGKMTELENDSRLLQMGRLLGKNLSKNPSYGKNDNSRKPMPGFRTDDLNTVLGVAGDDEAAKLISSISVSQMIKVLSALAQQKRRSTPLLRSLAFNISSANEQLDLKQCADVLYAMATLNFQDSVLAAKICADVQNGLNKNTEKSAVCGSILTSLGILKYRDLDIMESITDWILKNNEICRPQDINSLLLTSALLNFKSAKINEIQYKLTKTVVKNDFPKKIDWLNNVWAMVMLEIADNSHLESVLREEFIKEIGVEKNGLTPTTKMKLLNVNSYASFIATSYSGPTIAPNSEIFNLPIAHSKSKQVLVNGMLDAIKSLLPLEHHFKSLVDSKMGFLIDGLCMFDSKRNPIPLDKQTHDGIKVAMMVIEYHDICHGAHRSISGITNLSLNLLEKKGYKVLALPYNEFNTSDKLLKRVQYLEMKFKEIVRLAEKT